MPDKSRQRHQSQSKKRKKRRDSSAIAAQQPPVSQISEQVSQPVISTPSASVITTKATQTAARYPYIISELKRIGILAGVMLTTLVVLALVLA